METKLFEYLTDKEHCHICGESITEPVIIELKDGRKFYLCTSKGCKTELEYQITNPKN